MLPVSEAAVTAEAPIFDNNNNNNNSFLLNANSLNDLSIQTR